VGEGERGGREEKRHKDGLWELNGRGGHAKLKKSNSHGKRWLQKWGVLDIIERGIEREKN